MAAEVHKCYYCEYVFQKIGIRSKTGADIFDSTIDHIIPIAKGGSNDRRNKRHACVSCNNLKDRLSPEAFSEKVLSLFNAKNIVYRKVFTKERLAIMYKNINRLIDEISTYRHQLIRKGYGKKAA